MSIHQLSAIKINFKGGIISPGMLYNVMVAARNCKIEEVSFGLRQQMLVAADAETTAAFAAALKDLKIGFQSNFESAPNIVSSFPAQEIFITNNWLSEGVYKDIFDELPLCPQLKINVSDSDQSFTPLFTGNINWVASPQAHYWYLFRLSASSSSRRFWVDRIL